MKNKIFLMAICTSLTSMACNISDAGNNKPASGVIDTTSTTRPAAAPPQAKPDTITFALTGDIMMGTTFPHTALPPKNGAYLFKDVKKILKGADIAVGNLEGTISDTTTHTKKKPSKYCYAFRTPVEFSPRLKEAGYDFLSMANNHANDFGKKGILSTEAELDKQGIKYAGVKGRTEGVIIERDGVKYGFCAFGHSSYTLKHRDLGKVKSIIDSLCKRADIVVVSFHGGKEGKQASHLPQGSEEFLGEDRGSLREFAHFCIDNGADIVYGHGPHVVRCVEMYKGRFIAYSLGNFCTPYGISITGISGYAPVIEVRTDRQGRFIDGHIYPFIQRRGLGPRTDKTKAVIKQIKKLTATDIKGSRLRILNDGTIKPANKDE